MPAGRGRAPRPGRLLRFAAALVVVAGCGASRQHLVPAPELSRLVVGTLPVPDTAALYVAIQRGFFRQVGLTVQPETLPASAAAAPRLMAGREDVAAGNYVTLIAEAKAGAPWRIIANAYVAAPGAFVVLTVENSTIRSPADLKNKTIGVPSLRGIGTLAVTAALAPYAITGRQVHFVVVAFPSMESALSTHRVDAVWANEPWLTKIQTELGAGTVVDTMTGATEQLPISGWYVTASFAARYPRTVSASQHAMLRAQMLLTINRSVTEQIVPTYTNITPTVAGILSLASYPTSLDPVAIQRVADLMTRTGYLPQPYKVQPLLIEGPWAPGT